MRRRLPLVSVIVVGVVVAGLAVASGWLGVLTLQNRGEEDQKAKAVQSARQMGVNLMSLSADTLQRDLDRIVDGTTGELKNTLASQSQAFTERVGKANTKAVVNDVEAALVSIDDDSAEVMVSLTGTVTNDQVKEGTPQAYRYQMDLSRIDDRWLVSRLEVVP